MSKDAAGRQYQDSVFRAYFNDADRLRDLAGALHGRTYTADDAVEIVTLEGTFLSQVKNDISFLLAGRHLVFIEHQSTPNENMPLPNAIRTAMRTCIERDIMRKFLEEHAREVVDMVNFEWNQELFETAKFEEGLEQGRAEGRDEERGVMILNMLREKMPLEMIAKVSNLSLEKVRELGRVHSLL